MASNKDSEHVYKTIFVRFHMPFYKASNKASRNVRF